MSESKSCNKCTNRRMCHKRKDADIRLDGLIEIVGRDMIPVPSKDGKQVMQADEMDKAVAFIDYAKENNIECKSMFSSKKADYLRDIVEKMVREHLFTCMAGVCSAYCEEKLIELVSPDGSIKARYSSDAARRMLEAHGVDLAKEIPKLLPILEMEQKKVVEEMEQDKEVT